MKIFNNSMIKNRINKIKRKFQLFKLRNNKVFSKN